MRLQTYLNLEIFLTDFERVTEGTVTLVTVLKALSSFDLVNILNIESNGSKYYHS
jgi:hypothetical protein